MACHYLDLFLLAAAAAWLLDRILPAGYRAIAPAKAASIGADRRARSGP